MATLRLEVLDGLLMASCEVCNWAMFGATRSVCPCCGRRFNRVVLITQGAEKVSAPSVSQFEN